MNKVTALLLSMKFPTLNTSDLMEVINATPNPVIATEIMCGIYEQPIFTEHQEKKDAEYGVLTFKSFNKWSQKVDYSYVRNITKSGYFPKGTNKSDVTIENFKSLEVPYSSGNCEHLSIPTEETENRTSSMDLDNWMNRETLSYALQA